MVCVLIQKLLVDRIQKLVVANSSVSDSETWLYHDLETLQCPIQELHCVPIQKLHCVTIQKLNYITIQKLLCVPIQKLLLVQIQKLLLVRFRNFQFTISFSIEFWSRSQGIF